MTTIIGVRGGDTTVVAADGFAYDDDAGIGVDVRYRKVSCGSRVVAGVAGPMVAAHSDHGGVIADAVGTAREFRDAMRGSLLQFGAGSQPPSGVADWGLGAVICEVETGDLWDLDACLGLTPAGRPVADLPLLLTATGSGRTVAMVSAICAQRLGEEDPRTVAEFAVRRAIELDALSGGSIYMVVVRAGKTEFNGWIPAEAP